MNYWDTHCKITESQYPFATNLCSVFNGADPIFRLVCPTNSDLVELDSERLPICYWGRGGWSWGVFEYSPLRQNLVLLMCAMNNEL